MAKVKANASPTPQKSTKAPKAPKPKATAPKVAHLSQQYVADSDDEAGPPENRSVKKIAAPKPQSSSKSKVKAEPKAAVKEEPKSSSDTNASSDEDSSLPAEPAPPKQSEIVPKTNGVKRKVEEPSSSEGSEESEDELPDAPEAKRAKTTPSSDDDSSEEDSSEEQDAKPKATPKVTLPPKQPTPTQHANPTEPIPAQPFEAPAGYVAVNIQQAGSSTDYSTASLAGKQIWHITAPWDVPISSITEVALDAIQTMKSVLSHKGAEYVLNEDAAGDEHESVLLPGKDGYVVTQQQVHKKLHLQQKITLPNLSARQASQVTGSTAAADVAQAAVRSVRPQPKGLRMRYKPPGFGPGTPGAVGSGSESADEDERPAGAASFQFPRALGAHATSEGHKQDGAGKVPGVETSTKKPKKKRKEKQSNPAVVADGAVEGTRAGGAEASHQSGATSSAALTPAMKVVVPEAVEVPDVSMTDAGADMTSKEEKPKRKKKESRMKAKEASG
ncbi:hypothetical protein LTR08_005705 [Meristemomyces frigidus]|nr:hypothetical protein LTR08_005705 [Meristemomyces frigidus]